MRAQVHLLGGGSIDAMLIAEDTTQVAWLVRCDRVLIARYFGKDGGARVAIIPTDRIQLISLEDDDLELCRGDPPTAGRS